MDFEYSSLSDVGRQRANNEDAVLVDAEHGIVVLADGMGVAGALLVLGIGKWMQKRPGPPPPTAAT